MLMVARCPLFVLTTIKAGRCGNHANGFDSNDEMINVSGLTPPNMSNSIEGSDELFYYLTYKDIF